MCVAPHKKVYSRLVPRGLGLIGTSVLPPWGLGTSYRLLHSSTDREHITLCVLSTPPCFCFFYFLHLSVQTISHSFRRCEYRSLSEPVSFILQRNVNCSLKVSNPRIKIETKVTLITRNHSLKTVNFAKNYNWCPLQCICFIIMSEKLQWQFWWDLIIKILILIFQFVRYRDTFWFPKLLSTFTYHKVFFCLS